MSLTSLAAMLGASALLPGLAVAGKPDSNYVWFEFVARPTERAAYDAKSNEFDLCQSDVQSEVLVDSKGTRRPGNLAFKVKGREVNGMPSSYSTPSVTNVDIETMVRVLSWPTSANCDAGNRPGTECGTKPGTFTFGLDVDTDGVAPLVQTKGVFAAIEKNAFSPVTYANCGQEPPAESFAAGSSFQIPDAPLRRFFGLDRKSQAACSRTSEANIRKGCKADFSTKYSDISNVPGVGTRESIIYLDFKLDGYCIRNKACWEVGRKGFKKTKEAEPPFPTAPLVP